MSSKTAVTATGGDLATVGVSADLGDCPKGGLTFLLSSAMISCGENAVRRSSIQGVGLADTTGLTNHTIAQLSFSRHRAILCASGGE